MPEICSKCGNEFAETTKYLGKQYCQDCYRRQVDEEAALTSNNDLDFGEGIIKILKIFSIIYLAAGIFIAAYIWYHFGTVTYGRFSVKNPVGISIGFILLAQSVFGTIILHAVSAMVNNLIAIRKNTGK